MQYSAKLVSKNRISLILEPNRKKRNLFWKLHLTFIYPTALSSKQNKGRKIIAIVFSNGGGYKCNQNDNKRLI